MDREASAAVIMLAVFKMTKLLGFHFRAGSALLSEMGRFLLVSNGLVFVPAVSRSKNMAQKKK